MRYLSFQIVIEKDQDGNGYYSYSPTLPGCFSRGDSLEETKANMREAIQLHVEHLLERGLKVPQDGQTVHVEDYTLALPA